jgi:hypothetical protein
MRQFCNSFVQIKVTFKLNEPHVAFIQQTKKKKKKKSNSVASVRERTIPTERPPLVGEVIANFADRG